MKKDFLKELFNTASHRAFTLAEVLITLTIIGVVSAITIPQLVKNMNNYAFSKAQTIMLAKITESTNEMKSNDMLGAYATTSAFADEFQKYIKVEKRCTAANLSDCFAPTFTTAAGKTITTSTLTTGDKLGQSTYTSPTVAFGLANGTTMLFAFNPACVRIDPVDNQTNTTSCLAMVYDTNGNSKPNIIGKDIGGLNVKLDCTPFGSLCVADADVTFGPINTCNGGAAADKAFDPTGSTNSNCANNRWAGAKKACDAIGMRLPVGGSGSNELKTMFQNYDTGGNTIKMNAAHYWSSTPASSADTAWSQNFGTGGEQFDYYGKGNSSLVARCVQK